ncbi:hypothetical protein N9L68_03255 [bacterium]|nr:hypothetical protein [bacterium]
MSTGFAARIVLVASVFSCSSSEPANAFLGSSAYSSPMTIEELHRELVQTDHGELDAIERVLAPMYATLPKNANGKLGHATVCYALHRHFVQQHGWFINGMSPDGSGWNSSSMISPMQERAPAHVQELLERHLGSRGLSLRELAALASVLHNQVNQEYLGRSNRAYRMTEAPIEGRATEQQFTKAITLWLTMLIIGPDMYRVNDKQIAGAASKMRRYFPHWDALLLWVEDVRQTVAYTQRARQNPFVGASLPLEALHQVASEVPKRFGGWHNSVCTDMKRHLLGLEDTRSTGRVSLGSFYGGESAGDDWRFIESVEYLRELGALDESDPKRLRVIVPNYLSGPNNCIEASALHTYCCKDECGMLRGEVERDIAVPMGAASDIARIVSRISSDTVEAPRNLTSELMSKLESVASRHGGRVPLHGRLFAQWMHHAFPNECPHPHVSGTTAPQTTDAFKKSGGNAFVTGKDRAQYIAAHTPPKKLSEDEAESLLWSEEEELLSYEDFNLQSWFEIGSLRSSTIPVSLLLLAAFLSVTAGRVRFGSAGFGGAKGTFQAREKYLV